MIKLNEALLKSTFENIKKLIDDKSRLSLAWLIVKNNKCAVLIVCKPEPDDEEDCMLFDLSGKLLYQQHYNDSNTCSYYDVFSYFETEYDKFTQFTDIVTTDTKKYDMLIVESRNNIMDMYITAPENECIKGRLAESPLKELRFICSIFKLNRLFGIPSDDMQSTFYLRFAAINENCKTVLYHDIEYIGDKDGFQFIDDYILDRLY